MNIKPFCNAGLAAHVNRKATKGWSQKAPPGWGNVVGVSYGGQAEFVGKELGAVLRALGLLQPTDLLPSTVEMVKCDAFDSWGEFED